MVGTEPGEVMDWKQRKAELERISRSNSPTDSAEWNRLSKSAQGLQPGQSIPGVLSETIIRMILVQEGLIVPVFKAGDSVKQKSGTITGTIKQIYPNIQRLDGVLEITYLLESGENINENDLEKSSS